MARRLEGVAQALLPVAMREVDCRKAQAGVPVLRSQACIAERRRQECLCYARLLVSQSHHGVDLRSATCRNIARQQGDGYP